MMDGTFSSEEIRVRKDSRLSDPCFDPSVATHLGYRPRREHRMSALLIDISPDTDQSLIHRVFGLHLDCLNRHRGLQDSR
jgi:hypothetical protein